MAGTLFFSMPSAAQQAGVSSGSRQLYHMNAVQVVIYNNINNKYIYRIYMMNR